MAALASAGSRCPRLPVLLRLQVLDEFVRLLLRDFPGDSVMLLDFPDELLALPVDHVEIIVREPALLLFHLTLRLFPLPLHLVPVHLSLP